MRRNLMHFVFVLSLLLSGPSVASAIDYSFISIDFPGASHTNLDGINNAGQAVGVYAAGGTSHGFLPSGGGFTTINFPGASDTEPQAINDAGQIVGYYGDPSNHGFLLSGGSFSTIFFPGAFDTAAFGINNGGQIVGGYDDGGANRGFLFSEGSFTTIDFPGASHTQAYGINDLGQIVGKYNAGDGSDHGFLLSGGSFSTIDFPGASGTVVFKINNAGQAVGSYAAGGTNHGFLLSGGSFSTIDFPGAPETIARGINDAGQIVGYYVTGTSHGFLATLFPPVANTPSGSNVVVSPGSGTTVTFSDVASGGNTAVTVSSTGPASPVGFSLGDPPIYYDVTTTTAFSGSVTVCIAYDPARYADINALQLLHFENNAWANVTTSNDITNHIVCGQVSSLSVFAIAQRVVIPVSIDIKPGSFPNSINLGSGGTVPVAILSTPTFDARTVDPVSITLASAPVKLKGKGTPMASFEDVNKDGLLDLVVHVSTSALQLSVTDTEAVLEGKTSDGTPIRGKDTVRVIP